MKTNIWGEEISCCADCKFWNRKWQYCKQLKKELLSEFNDETCELEFINYEEIHLDCPFIQIIDKSVFEELEFEYGEYCKKQINGDIIEIHNYDKLHNLWIIRLIGDTGILTDNITLYNGKIHNPEELKFILNSIL